MVTSKTVGTQRTVGTDADLLAWPDLARCRNVIDVRSLLLLAIERQLTLGVYADAWYIEYGRLSYDEHGDVDQEGVEGEDKHTGFTELQKPVLESLLRAETVQLDYLYRDNGQFARVVGRFVANTFVDAPVHVSRDDLCGRLMQPGLPSWQFPSVGPEHSAKKQDGDERLIAVLVELYRQEMAKKAKTIYESGAHGLQTQIVNDINKLLTNGKLDNDLLGLSTLKSKIGKALAKIKELKLPA